MLSGPDLANQQKNQLRGKQKRLRTPIIRKLDIKSRSHGIILLFTDLSQYPLSLCMIPGNVVFVGFPFSTKSSILQRNHLISSEIVLRGIKGYWRAQQLSDGDDDTLFLERGKMAENFTRFAKKS